MGRTTWNARAASLALSLTAPLLTGVTAAPSAAETTTEPAYHAVKLTEEGRVEGSLDGLKSAVRAEVGSGGQIVVLVHGFATPLEKGRQDYTAVARRLEQQAAATGVKTAVVGVHWSSDVGPLHSWMGKAVGARLTSLLGFKKAIRNPYLQKTDVARRTGRTGLRSVLFALQDAAPGAPVHLFAHSMGAEVVVSALSPERETRRSVPAEQPDRELRVGIVTLAGADLDEDAFVRKNSAALCLALDRAAVWWVTVPEKGNADGVLELRRGAGRKNAIGNVGLRLTRRHLNALIARRALVVDEGNVPSTHDLTDYFNERRVTELSRSMLYLRQPEAAPARQSVLAALDGVLRADNAQLASYADDKGCARLYALWRMKTGTRDLRTVTVANDRGDGGRRAESRVLGVRMAK